jgi:hypothetical protein
LPWSDESYDRVASTVDLPRALASAESGSFTEFLHCYEAAGDEDRPLTPQERYFLATYGKEYVENPELVIAKYTEIEQRAAGHIGKFVLVQKSPNFMILGKLASTKINYIPQIGRAAGVPMGTARLNLTGTLSTIIDDTGEAVPELCRDFIEWGASMIEIEERGTDVTWDENNRFDRCDHNGKSNPIIFANEMANWLAENPRWIEHVDNMIGAYTTGGINKPIANVRILK